MLYTVINVVKQDVAIAVRSVCMPAAAASVWHWPQRRRSELQNPSPWQSKTGCRKASQGVEGKLAGWEGGGGTAIFSVCGHSPCNPVPWRMPMPWVAPSHNEVWADQSSRHRNILHSASYRGAAFIEGQCGHTSAHILSNEKWFWQMMWVKHRCHAVDL